MVIEGVYRPGPYVPGRFGGPSIRRSNNFLFVLNLPAYKQIYENWKDEESCMTIQGTRRFDCHSVAIDISENAMAYGKTVGLFDDVIVADLNDTSLVDAQKQVKQALSETDVFLSTAALVYLDLETIERVVEAFASKPTEGYMLVNFLNPFSLDKADETKRVLVKHLDFVGSMAARHRRMSPLEVENYPVGRLLRRVAL